MLFRCVTRNILEDNLNKYSEKFKREPELKKYRILSGDAISL